MDASLNWFSDSQSKHTFPGAMCCASQLGRLLIVCWRHGPDSIFAAPKSGGRRPVMSAAPKAASLGGRGAGGRRCNTHPPTWFRTIANRKGARPAACLTQLRRCLAVCGQSQRLPAAQSISRRDEHVRARGGFARAYGYFRCLAAVALASAIFVCRVFTRRFAPLVGIARASSAPDRLRGVRITASPLESI
jgi:hypothetical protein